MSEAQSSSTNDRGAKFEIDFLSEYSDEALLEELRRVSKLIATGQPLTASTYRRLRPKVSYSTVRRRFGGWKAALQKAGLGHRYEGPEITPRMKSQSGKQYSESELIAELNRVHEIAGTEWLSSSDFRTHSAISRDTIRRCFGSFHKGLAAAGILKRPHKLRAFTDEECLENIVNLWTHYGRQPLLRELRVPPSTILAKTYIERWGTWRRSLLSFVEWANSEGQSAEAPSEVEIEIETPNFLTRISQSEADRRDVRPGLRFRVFKRDNFRCVVCGRSPAMHLNIELHADHIMSVANGGKTVFENLQTLCQDCNLGKGKN